MNCAERRTIAVCYSWEDEENLNLILNELIKATEPHGFLPVCISFDRNSIDSRGNPAAARNGIPSGLPGKSAT